MSKELSDLAHDVTQNEATERPFSSPLNDEKRDGVYHCIICDKALFDSSTKYNSGSGWPSFYTAKDGALGGKADRKLFMKRTEIHCQNCGAHMGHVFPDGPKPTGLRYCVNGAALEFKPKA